MWLAKLALFVGLAVGAFAQTTTPVTLNPGQFCEQFNGSHCEPCVNAWQNSTGTACFYCASNKTCRPFTKDTVFGLPCPNYEYNVGTCTLTAKVIAILIGVAVLLFLMMVICCCCCCCCCCVMCARRRKRMMVVEENAYLDEKDQIRQTHADRRQERRAKHDEIRRKYGLGSDDHDEDHDQLLVNES